MCLRLTVTSGAAQHSLQRNLPVCESHSVGDMRVMLPKHVIVSPLKEVMSGSYLVHFIHKKSPLVS